jgi:catechol 2,3-dioxygenase-like lactoylglutathione lyase family enzyme
MSLSDHPVGPVAAVSDLDRAREFYEQKLGLRPGENAPEGTARYVCGEGSELFVYLSPEHAGRCTATLAGWGVDDLESEVDELISRGVTLEQYDLPGIKTNEKGISEADGGKVAFVKDPDGNTFAINEGM